MLQNSHGLLNHRRALLAAGSVAVLAGHAVGQTMYNWVPTFGGNWITKGNWSVPASFPNSATHQAVISAIDPLNPSNLYTVTLANGITVQDLTINSPQATLSINSGGGLNTAGPINVQQGTLKLNGGSILGSPPSYNFSPTTKLLVEENATLPPSGALTFSGDLDIHSATFQYTRSGGFTNQGRITLGGTTPSWLFMQEPLLNQNRLTFEPIPGSSHTLSAVLTNAPTGVVDVNGSVAVFSGNTVNQGMFNLNNSQYSLGLRSFSQTGGTLTATGNAVVQAGGFSAIGGTIVGPLIVNHPNGSPINVTVGGGVTFDSISLDGRNGGGIFNVNGPATGTVNITLPCTYFANGAGFDTGLAIQNTNADPFADAVATIPGSITNNGSLFFSGGATANSQGLVVFPGGNFINGPQGRMGGRCRHDFTNLPGGTFFNHGTLDVRSDFDRALAQGYLSIIVSNMNFASTSVVETELKTVPGTPTIGTISVSGGVLLNGTARVTIPAGYVPPIDTAKFPFLTAASVSGAFSSVEVTGGRPEDVYGVEYTSTQVLLTARQGTPPCPCAADFDQSGGTPDGTDIAAFFATWLLGLPEADVDCSGGTPDGTDIALFFSHWLAGGC